MTADFPVLELLDLEVGFSGTPVVRGINLSIESGETLALVGESGCGKSLTAFSILRILPPRAAITAGQVVFEGEDLATVPAWKLRQIRGKGIALILQEPMTSLNPVLSIGFQIAENIRQHERISARQAKERTIELLDLVGIADPRRRYDMFPHNFSGGMRQRAVIAMAIACNPRLLIADEPTTALDVTIQAQVMELLGQLRRQLSMSILLITHDLGAVAQWADRVAVMYAGRIVEQAPVADFFRGPRHPYSLGLLHSSVAEDLHYTAAPLTEIPGSIQSAAGETGCRFAPRCVRALPACRAASPAVTQLAPEWTAECYRLDLPNGAAS